MPLKQRFKAHIRVRGGAIYAYDILNGEQVIGSKLVTIDKKTRPWTETARYMLGEHEFGSAWALHYAWRCSGGVDADQA